MSAERISPQYRKLTSIPVTLFSCLVQKVNSTIPRPPMNPSAEKYADYVVTSCMVNGAVHERADNITIGENLVRSLTDEDSIYFGSCIVAGYGLLPMLRPRMLS